MTETGFDRAAAGAVGPVVAGSIGPAGRVGPGGAEHRVEQLDLAGAGATTELDRVVVAIGVVVRIWVALGHAEPATDVGRGVAVAVLAQPAGGEDRAPDVLGDERGPATRIRDGQRRLDLALGVHGDVERVDRDGGRVVAAQVARVGGVVGRFRDRGPATAPEAGRRPARRASSSGPTCPPRLRRPASCRRPDRSRSGRPSCRSRYRWRRCPTTPRPPAGSRPGRWPWPRPGSRCP